MDKHVVSLAETRSEPIESVVEACRGLLRKAESGELRAIAYAYTYRKQDGSGRGTRFSWEADFTDDAIHLGYFLGEIECEIRSAIEDTWECTPEREGPEGEK